MSLSFHYALSDSGMALVRKLIKHYHILSVLLSVLLLLLLIWHMESDWNSQAKHELSKEMFYYVQQHHECGGFSMKNWKITMVHFLRDGVDGSLWSTILCSTRKWIAGYYHGLLSRLLPMSTRWNIWFSKTLLCLTVHLRRYPSSLQGWELFYFNTRQR